MKSPRNRRPRAPSSVLATLGTLQLGALGLLLRVDFMDSLSNYYLESADELIIRDFKRAYNASVQNPGLFVLL